MSQTPLVPPSDGPPSDGDSGSDRPAEQGLPASALTGSGPQNAVAPGADPSDPAPDGDASLAAPAGDPGASTSDLGSASDAGSFSGSDGGASAGSDPMPDMTGTDPT